MYCLFPAVILAFILSACAMPSSPFVAAGHLSAPTGGQFRFDWQLSGSRAVAPLQVFDDGKHTWLQFSQVGPVPAIFARTAAGDVPLRYRREGDYLILSGVWPELILRGGHLQSRVKRIDHAQPSAAVSAQDAAVSVNAQTIADQTAVTQTTSVAATQTTGEDSKDQAVNALVESSFATSVAQPAPVYTVELSDGNLRLALVRWARRAGWTFAPEHWAVDVDIPLTASASFDADFKNSVQALIGSTELADRPLRPCFYSNQVLRIVPYAQPCERNASLARAS